MTVKVTEIMRKKFITVEPSNSVFDLIERLLPTHERFAIVVDPSEGPIGIVTLWDFLERVLVKKIDPQKAKVSEIMTRGLVTIPSHLLVSEAAELMSKKNFRNLPIVEKEKIIGVITSWDILLNYISEITARFHGWDLLAIKDREALGIVSTTSK